MDSGLEVISIYDRACRAQKMIIILEFIDNTHNIMCGAKGTGDEQLVT